LATDGNNAPAENALCKKLRRDRVGDGALVAVEDTTLVLDAEVADMLKLLSL